MSNELPARQLERTVRPVRHGTDCKKVEHLGDGYLHRADDNWPYDVDGLVYCGRCHEWLGTISSGTDPVSGLVLEPLYLAPGAKGE